jgi:hypothetical protein
VGGEKCFWHRGWRSALASIECRSAGRVGRRARGMRKHGAFGRAGRECFDRGFGGAN